MKILIADGSRVMRRIVMRTLRQAGLVGQELVEAADGYEALRAAIAEDPDLLLCDWDLPGLDGLALLSTLRARGDQVRFGLLSASSSPEMVVRSEEAGALFVIAKPPTPESFRAWLQLPDVASGPGVPEGVGADRSGNQPTAVPSPKAVRDLLEGLLGRDVEVAVADPFAPGPGEGATLGVYVDGSLRARAVTVADLHLSAYAGAAIGLVPVVGAEVAIEERELTPVLQENLYEVLNVCAALLNDEGLPHLKLHAVYPAGGAPAPSDVVAFAGVLGQRLDLVVTVASYGTGRLSVVCLG